MLRHRRLGDYHEYQIGGFLVQYPIVHDRGRKNDWTRKNEAQPTGDKTQETRDERPDILTSRSPALHYTSANTRLTSHDQIVIPTTQSVQSRYSTYPTTTAGADVPARTLVKTISMRDIPRTNWHSPTTPKARGAGTYRNEVEPPAPRKHSIYS